LFFRESLRSRAAQDAFGVLSAKSGQLFVEIPLSFGGALLMRRAMIVAGASSMESMGQS
jgi:hypothetical protein